MVEFYVNEHNTKMPHPAFSGQTPDEMFFLDRRQQYPKNCAGVRAMLAGSTHGRQPRDVVASACLGQQATLPGETIPSLISIAPLFEQEVSECSSFAAGRPNSALIVVFCHNEGRAQLYEGRSSFHSSVPHSVDVLPSQAAAFSSSDPPRWLADGAGAFSDYGEKHQCRALWRPPALLPVAGPC